MPRSPGIPKPRSCLRLERRGSVPARAAPPCSGETLFGKVPRPPAEGAPPPRRMERRYTLSVERTLFGDWAAVREWGPIGRPGGGGLEEWFADVSEAEERMRAIGTAKRRRGYGDHGGE